MTIADFDKWARTIMDFSIKDRSLNGLQVGSLHKPLKRMAFALDACAHSFSLAKDADLLFVHHGLFWGAKALNDDLAMYKRVKQLIESDLALYALHLPLDVAKDFGINHALAQKAQLENIINFNDFGIIGDLLQAMYTEDLAQKVFHPYPFQTWTHHNKPLTRVAIIGGAGAREDWIQEAFHRGADGYITGEMHHQIYHYTGEMPINMIAGGHYWSEFIGLLRFVEEVRSVFPELIIDIYDLPTGC